jgi:hypothetical protein
VQQADVAPLRKLLRSLCRPGQRRLHFKKERDSRRREILSALVAAKLVIARVYATRPPGPGARADCLLAAVPDLIDLNVGELILEHCEPRQEARDRQVAARRRPEVRRVFVYRHAAPASEAGLWVADAVAWAYGAGGDWRRRVRPLIDNVWELDR